MKPFFEYLFGSVVSKTYGVLTNVMTELTFLAICIGGLIICASSLIFGHDGDAHADHHVEFGHHGNDDSSHEQGPGFLSIRGLSLLAVGFGAVGFIVFHYTQKPLVASLAGLASGWLFASLALLVLRTLLHQQSNSLLETSAIINAVGIVVTSIPEGGQGEITLAIQGRKLTRVATAQGGAISRGISVRILNSAGGIVVVEPVTASPTHA